jgi:hypothetical protein
VGLSHTAGTDDSKSHLLFPPFRFLKNYNLNKRVINRESKIIAISLRRIGNCLAIAVNVARSIYGNLLPFVIARLPERKPWQSPFLLHYFASRNDN